MTNSLNSLTKQTILLTLGLGIIGFLILIFLNINYAISYIIGSVFAIIYIWHLSQSVKAIEPKKKNTKFILRVTIFLTFILISTEMLSLNMIFMFLGFLLNHLSLLALLGINLVKSKVG